MAFLFPNGRRESVENAMVQRTLALIRPSALAHYKEQILNKIKEHGFKIAMMNTIQLDRQQAEEFYAEHRDKPFYENLITEMTR